MSEPIELVAPDPAFAEVFAGWRSEPLTLQFNPIKPMTVEELRAHLGNRPRLEDGLRENDTFRWFVKSRGELVGNVSLKSANAMMQSAEIGYAIGSRFQGRGLATAAVAELIDHVFELTTLRKLTAFVHAGNAASCRVLEKLGFTREGCLREHYLINGQPVDEVVFGLLRREWRRPV